MWGFLEFLVIVIGGFLAFLYLPFRFIYKMIKPNGDSRLKIGIIYPVIWIALIFGVIHSTSYINKKKAESQQQAAIEEAQETQEKAEKERLKATQKAEKDAKKAAKKAEKAKEERLSKSGMIIACSAVIEPNLHNPKSMDIDYGATKQVEINGKPGLELYYYATNGFGATIRSRALCEFDENGFLMKVTQ